MWHPQTICPNCSSQVRHRLLVAALDDLDSVGWQRLVDGKRVLHFAPERTLQAAIRSRAFRYVSADLMADGGSYPVDIGLDIADMPAVESGAIDCLIACDVLEHVPDHRRALSEISRVLAPGGCAILTVPQKDGLQETFEDPSAATPEARRRVFGQWNHLRIYGDDFPHMLEEIGFSVVMVDDHCFLPETALRLVLCPPVRSINPLATNYRKVFFAFK